MIKYFYNPVTLFIFFNKRHAAATTGWKKNIQDPDLK